MLTIADLAFSPARPVDLVDVRALLERCRLPTEDLEHAHLEHFVVCRADEELVGVVGLEVLGKMALLRSLAVAPTHRGRRVDRGYPSSTMHVTANGTAVSDAGTG